MEMSDVFGGDLSLFNGDLVGLTAFDELPDRGLEGRKSGIIRLESRESDTDIVVDYTDVLGESNDWIEKKQDLINLLSSPNVEVTIQTVASSPPSVPFSTYDESCPTTLKNFDASEELAQLQDSLNTYTEMMSADLQPVVPASVAVNDFNGLNDVDYDDSFMSLLSDEEFKNLGAPLLSPMSADDVSSILGSMPSSPESYQVDSSLDIGSRPALLDTPPPLSPTSGPQRVPRRRTKKYMPYDDDTDYYPSPPQSPVVRRRHGDRRERKKQQNKDAALRYRQKKKEELSTIFDECDSLELTNRKLTNKVEGMEREVEYLKELLLDVYKAKGIEPPQLLSSM